MKINLGCGMHPLAGYVNVDLIRYPEVNYTGLDFYKVNALEFLQLRKLGASEIRADQFLEHLKLSDGLELLRLCHSALQPRGRLYMTIPDWGAHVADYIERKQRIPLSNPTVKDGMFRPEINVMVSILYDWGHQMIYDSEMLRAVLNETGWENAKITQPDGANLVVEGFKGA